MKKTIKFLLSSLAMALFAVSAFAQVTTSALGGLVTEENGEPLIGAVVIAKHGPTGSTYYAVTNNEGRYYIGGMRAGGPYTVEVSYLGFQTITRQDVTMKLGDLVEMNEKMASENMLASAVVSAESGFSAVKTGAGDSFNRAQMDATPTIDRSIYDIVKYTPQATVNRDGGISFGGSNIRYNSFQIDGAIANDAFGLSSQGTVGGQTNSNPISLDAIEEVQVVVAPFDVRQGGFTGGAINAITKSGTNTVKASAYGYYYNQDMIGKTPGPLSGDQALSGISTNGRTKYDTQSTYTVGATVGAPIVKDKLFIFVSAEYYRQTIPNVYCPANGSYNTDKAKLKKEVVIDDGTQGGKSLGQYLDANMAEAILNHYKELFGFRPDEYYTEHQKNNQSINAMARIDWNISDKHKLMARYQLLDGSYDMYGSGATTYYFGNSSAIKKNRTHTIVAELNSRCSDKVQNEFRATATLVKDKREAPYQGPTLYIKDNTYIDLGTEYSSGANSMDNNTFTIADNVTIFAGNHNITVGTHNEFHTFQNVFIQYFNGEYEYANLNDFFNDSPSAYYYNYADRAYSGGQANYAATTYAAQFGLYAQDEWRPNRNFTLTYGLRFDLPMLMNAPTVNEQFNNSAISQQTGEKVGTTPNASLLVSPRVGFRLWVDEEHNGLLRGGAGIFTGRVPFVWLSNAYNNTGIEMHSTKTTPVPEGFFTANPYADLVEKGKLSAAKSTINTLNENFKYPQVFRANLGYDHDFGKGWSMTLDALYTKNINNVFFTNLAIQEDGFTYAVNSSNANFNNVYQHYTVDDTYANVTALSNTSKGYSYSLSAQLKKHFNFGLDLMASYTFGHSYSANDGNSSVALSNWQNYLATDANTPEISYSVYDRPHKINVVINYTSPVYAKILRTNVSLAYTGSSGSRFSYVMKETADYNGDGYTKNALLYVPTQAEIGQMKWADPADAYKYENYIRQDSYLSSHRGQFTERFGGITPFEHHVDFHFAQDFIYNKKRGSKVSLIVDILNLTNLFNPEWGIYYSSSWTRQVLEVTGLSGDSKSGYTPTYSYNSKPLTITDFASRWKLQAGLRFTF